jgi:predicted metalloprotease with PDZ domain
MRERESREGTADGWPGDLSAPGARIMPPGHPQWHFPPRWWLGVYGYNTPSGVVITRVVPDSPAEHAGLERNDKIVTVDGFQVGYIQRRLYPLGAELQLRAGPDGRVLLLVQNWRNDELENIDARLASGGVRDREFRLPGFQQGDERSQ